MRSFDFDYDSSQNVYYIILLKMDKYERILKQDIFQYSNIEFEMPDILKLVILMIE